MRWGILILAALISLWTQGAEPKAKPYRLPAVDLKQDVIWGASAVGGEYELFFGGQDQGSEDGVGHTRFLKDGGLVKTIDDLRRQAPQKKFAARLNGMKELQKTTLTNIEGAYLSGNNPPDRFCLIFINLQVQIMDKLAEVAESEFNDTLRLPIPGERDTPDVSRAIFNRAFKSFRSAVAELETEITPTHLKRMRSAMEETGLAAQMLGAEPSPRALSPIVYLPKLEVFLIVGGDHGDYLTNDTWIFRADPSRWELLHPSSAPPPRANHTLRANADGTITLSGGYTYANNTDYMGGQYVDLDDGDWTFDIVKNTWSHSTEKGVAPTTRTYRTGPFHPDYFLDGPKPDPAGFKKLLDDIPVNTWVKTNPPRLPQMNRDWGTAVIAPDRDLILRWAGGHSAHGGTDVLHFHLSTNRWELTHPVEFPLGQLYTNTAYPDGFNCNRRPWITGHTYQSYVYDEQSQKLLFLGRRGHMYFYDPAIGDWAGRTGKPAELSYDSCYYTLTTTATPQGVFCWTRDGLLFVYEPAKTTWKKVELKGEKLAGSVVDNSTLTHEPKSQRLYFFRKPYGDKAAYDGKVQSVDVRSGTVTTHIPENARAAEAVPYLCQIRCHPPTGLLFVGGTLPPDESGVRRTPAYDPVKNRWVSLKIGGEDPSGKSGRNVSLGLMWDAHRRLFWAVDAKSQVYVLRLEVEGAEMRGME